MLCEEMSKGYWKEYNIMVNCFDNFQKMVPVITIRSVTFTTVGRLGVLGYGRKGRKRKYWSNLVVEVWRNTKMTKEFIKEVT